MTGRDPTQRDKAITLLPCGEGGWVLAGYRAPALANFSALPRAAESLQGVERADIRDIGEQPPRPREQTPSSKSTYCGLWSVGKNGSSTVIGRACFSITSRMTRFCFVVRLPLSEVGLDFADSSFLLRATMC